MNSSRRLLRVVLALAAVDAVLVSSSRAGALLDPFVALPWGPSGTQFQDAFGEHVAPAGDVDGDGFGDVVVGHPLATGSEAFEGAVHVYLGSPQGSSLAPDWSYFSGQVRGLAGSAQASAGDVNRDGFADLLVGIPAWDTPADSNAGKVAVFHGGPSGLPLTPTYELASPTPIDDQAFGTAVAPAGDVNGDGFADVLVGANFDQGGVNRGVVYVFHGSASGLAATPDQAWLGPMGQGTGFGRPISSAGDVNGDGFADVILGAPNQTTPFLLGGAASLYLGTPLGAADDPDTTILGNANNLQLGFSVSLAGDVDGDGFGDVLVGSPGFNAGAGRAQLFRGGPSGIVSSEVVLTPENPPGDGFGRSVATLGDLDGDGFADFGVSAFHAPSFRGRIGVYRGGFGAIRYVGDILSRGDDGFFGSTFGTTGDTDGDGRAEILVGTEDMSATPGQQEGRTFQFRPPRVMPALAPGGWPRAGAQAGSRYGTAVAILPHHDNTNLGKLVIGDPNFDGFGRVSIHDGSTPSGVTFAEASAIVATTDAQAYGTRIVEAGDVNGDGYSDYAVSSPTLGGTSIIQTGAVELRFGRGGGPVILPLAVVAGESSFDRVGSALAGRGDVNGDGFHDLLIGAAGWDQPGLADCGKAFLFFGKPDGQATTLWTRLGTVTGQGLGAGVALADLDADGYTDVILGSSSPTFGSTAPGAVEVFYGGPSGPANTPGLVLHSLTPHVSFGLRLGTGDFTNDGVADLAVGAPGEDGRGVVRLYEGTLGRSQSTIPIRTLRGTQSGGRFGDAIAGGGDVDGDGRGDLAIGEPGWNGGLTSEGRVHLFFGGAGVPEIPAGFVVESNLLSGEMGASISPLRDLNGDGVADLVVGAPGAGRVFPFLGGGGPGPLFKLMPRSNGVEFFHPGRMPVADEVSLLFFMRDAGGGRARAKFQFETRTQNAAFTGTPTTALNSTFDTRTTDVIQTGVDFTPPLPGRAFKMRGRWTTPSPFFQRTRWITPEAHTSGDHDARLAGTSVGVPPATDARLRLLGVSPNPAGTGGASRIAFALPRDGRVTVDVIDLRGARLRRVLDGPRPAGPSSVSWDGRDEAGRMVASGVYFVVVRAGEADARAKVVRLP